MKTKEQKNENTKGITLIALVITIIILIILAGVTINLTIGENGIFNKAKQAKEDYKTAVNEEIRQIANVEVAIDDIVGGTTGENGEPTTPTIDSLKVGDYIKYNTGKTEIGDNGVVLCRVLYNDSTNGLQIITDKNITQKVNGVDEEILVNLEDGACDYAAVVEAYNNAIETLNNEAEKYLNSSYAYDARCVGSIPTVGEDGTFSQKDSGATKYVTLPFTFEGYISSLDGDENYIYDQMAMDAIKVSNGVTGNYWIASRFVDLNTDTDYAWFEVRAGWGNEVYNEYYSYMYYIEAGVLWTNIDNPYWTGYGLRPCFSLKSDIIKISGGDGKNEATAYTLGI